MKRTIAVALALFLGACDDGTPPPDADLHGGMDGGPRWTGPGCSETLGIECDGDWAGRCASPCGIDECCSPQRGRFACVPRGADGSCPAANIWVDESRIEGQTTVEWRYFPEGDCALIEGCVRAAGWRRLLVFGTWTPNTGAADLFLGRPSDEPPFVYSECHAHYHFEGYAQYELRANDGTLAAEGHKQAFCLLDYYRYPGTDTTGNRYTCGNQGIQRGWQDVYGADLDCQWVDVTDVAPGDYQLRIDLNVDHALLESSYDDNRADVAITIPVDAPTDITTECSFGRYGLHRECGWTAAPTVYRCSPGETVHIGCSSACGLGSCEGDTVMRVCLADGPCTAREVLASNDDSRCAARDHCSRVTLRCPGEEGTTTDLAVFFGPYDVLHPGATCAVAVSGATPR